MTGYSLYNTYVAQWSAGLASLDAILKKAEAHAKENGIDPDAAYVNASIHDDMKPLSFQVQIVIFAIKLPLNNLIGKAPEWSEELKTFADLHARVKSAQEYVNSVKPEDIDGREEEILTACVAFPCFCLYSKSLSCMINLTLYETKHLTHYRLGPISTRFPNGLSAKSLCDGYSTPNLYFHLVTAYDILRKEGVPLGKMDYMSPFLMKAI